MISFCNPPGRCHSGIKFNPLPVAFKAPGALGWPRPSGSWPTPSHHPALATLSFHKPLMNPGSSVLQPSLCLEASTCSSAALLSKLCCSLSVQWECCFL